ncbi:DNA-binding transcriptional LysR family regulator [Labedaea rhizosphaerae]|uniref:DNA-binding transcriptional LysR family regulator n=1 Tax=Labedaea rhizosphaerae TaxID=598644 RepID=A0A4R6SGR8_LABRH|nr:DNA-binding transcriptional LysR family regulator [Labedaea rhizosphaerae]
METFAAVVETGRFADAAADLGITQQAVSKRIAALERELGVRLLTRTGRGAVPTIDGQAFLPHARELLRVARRAADSVRPGGRPLRVEIVGRRLGPARLLREFHRAQPDTELDVVTLVDGRAALAALADGTIDAAVRAVPDLPEGLAAERVYDEPIQLLTGPRHPLADARTLTPADLAPYPIWMPGLVAGTEWTAYYDAFAEAFGLTIDVVGPHYGTEPLLDVIADSATLTTLVGEHTQLLWPADYDLRRIPLRAPMPVYPHSLVWRIGNPHPALAALRAHCLRTKATFDEPTWTGSTWTPVAYPYPQGV